MKSKIVKKGEYRGHQFVIVENEDFRFQWMCGYVEVPEDHPLHRKEYYDSIELSEQQRQSLLSQPIGKRGVIEVLTFDKDDIRVTDLFDVHGSLTWSGDLPSQYEQTGKWWFGFDTNHHDDHYMLDGKFWCKYPAGYVEEECKRLIDQLIEWERVLKEANDE